VATATDICTPVANITITQSDVSTQDANTANIGHYNYTITRTWTATDPALNAISCNQIITVQDVTKPVITCPANVTVNCQDNNSSTATAVATATDICTPVANITFTQSDVSTQNANTALASHYNYTITRTWTATDPALNAISCNQVITV